MVREKASKEEFKEDHHVLKGCRDKLVELRVGFEELFDESSRLLEASTCEEGVKKSKINYITGFWSKFIFQADEVELDLGAKISKLSKDAQGPIEPDLGRVSKISIRDFDEENPRLWFSELEHQFKARGITGQSAKFSCLSGVLGKGPSDVIARVTLAAEDNESSASFDDAKLMLLEAFELSRDERLDQVFNAQLDSDEKPSMFLGRLDVLLRDISMDHLRQWLVRRSLSAQFQITLLADKSINSAEELVKSADILVRKNREEDAIHVVRNKQKSSAKSFVKSQSVLCYWHEKFGDKATTCAGTPVKRCPMWRPKKSNHPGSGNGQEGDRH